MADEIAANLKLSYVNSSKGDGDIVYATGNSGLYMRETVRSLSGVGVRIFEGEFSSVREDLEKRTAGVPVVPPGARAG